MVQAHLLAIFLVLWWGEYIIVSIALRRRKEANFCLMYLMWDTAGAY